MDWSENPASLMEAQLWISGVPLTMLCHPVVSSLIPHVLQLLSSLEPRFGLSVSFWDFHLPPEWLCHLIFYGNFRYIERHVSSYDSIITGFLYDIPQGSVSQNWLIPLSHDISLIIPMVKLYEYPSLTWVFLAGGNHVIIKFRPKVFIYGFFWLPLGRRSSDPLLQWLLSICSGRVNFS